jgi:hypothetical protein
MTRPFINRAAANAASLVERVFRLFMNISVGETWFSFDGGILSAILQVLTRYSANDPQFPVDDRSLFTGKSHVVGGASRPNGPADGEGTPEAGLGAWSARRRGPPGGEASRVALLLGRWPRPTGLPFGPSPMSPAFNADRSPR